MSGDFDGQGISFGVLQWNFGQGSLQPLLTDMVDRHPNVMARVFGGYLDPFAAAIKADKDDLLNFARSVQHPVTHAVFEPRRGHGARHPLQAGRAVLHRHNEVLGLSAGRAA